MPNSTNYPSTLTSDLNITIANGASLSDAINLMGTTLVGYIMPAGWDAASITFQVSVDGSSFADMRDTLGNEVKHIVQSDSFVSVQPANFASVQHIKLRSGTTGAAVNQSAERVITLVTRVV